MFFFYSKFDFVVSAILRLQMIFQMTSNFSNRYPKTIAFAVEHFKECSLDALFLVTNTPGRSAYNRVERRMASLSNQLSGLILRHDTFGTHLDSRGRTVDPELERKNFASAGEYLAQIWSELVIDNHPVFAKYKEPGNDPDLSVAIDPLWYSRHVRESQYLLQVSL